MNFFELYNIPVSINLDLKQLKKKYFKLSRQFHPDNFVHATEEEKEQNLIQSTQVNEAYEVLNDETKRIAYILEISGIMEGKKEQLDPMFLMEMMEFNEEIDDVYEQKDEMKKEQVNAQITSHENDLKNDVLDIYNLDIITFENKDTLEKLKAYYLKMKYIKRIKEKIITFAIQ